MNKVRCRTRGSNTKREKGFALLSYTTRSVLALAFALSVLQTALADQLVYVSSGFLQSSNAVAALRIGANGELTLVSGSPFGTGSSPFPTGIAITPDARNVYTANGASNTVSGFNVRMNGELSLVPGSPFVTTANLPFTAAPSPDGRFLYVANHFDQSIGVWAIDPVGVLGQIPGSPFAIPTGQVSPFPVIAAPDGNHIYVPNESTDTVTAYAVAADGSLSSIQTIAAGNNPFGGAITPDGKFLYVSDPEPTGNFAGGAISAYAVGADGTLTAVPGSPFDVAPGNHPLGMAISPDGGHVFVATRVTNDVTVLAVAADGALSQVSGSPFPTGGLNGRAPALTPDGSRLYVSNTDSNDVSGLDVGANGTLTPLPGSPFPTGVTNSFLESVVITPNQPPTASFTVQTEPPGRASSFDASSSSDTDGSVVRFDWNFGDGSVLSNAGPTPQHTYAQPGTFTATLTVTDNEGCSVERIFTGKATLCNGSPVASTSQQVIVTPTVDLSVTKADSPDPLTRGDRLTYTVTTTNNGPSDATGVILTDLLPHVEEPEELTFISATPSQGTCSQAGGTITCNIGNLTSGNSATVKILVRPLAIGTITNLASVISNETDSDNVNNTATEDTTVNRRVVQITCAGLRATRAGTPASEMITGTHNRDVIQGRAGNDIIRGLRGNDVICGGRGRDRLFGQRGGDALRGGRGNDICNGGRGRDTDGGCETRFRIP